MPATSDRKRVLIVLDCGLSVPSAMVRALQFRPLFERSSAWEARFESRKSEKLQRFLNRTRRPSLPLVMRLVHRPTVAMVDFLDERREDRIVKVAKNFDLVYLIKMSHLRLYERLKELGGPKIVMDMNDGLWLPAFQATGWEDLEDILALCDAVICENEYVAGYARKFNSCVHIVPDSPQLEAFDRNREQSKRGQGKIVLGWIGAVENAGSLFRLVEPLEKLFIEHSCLHLRVLGADRSYLPRFESVQWSCRPLYNQYEMVAEALSFDIGLFPMFHNEDGLARGTLKAMVYMSAEVATVCENYGENPKLIEDGRNGLLASSPEEWYSKLHWLITDPAQRNEIAKNGLQTIRDRFTADRVFVRLESAFNSILENSKARSQTSLIQADHVTI